MGSFRRFMQVAADGRRSSCPPDITQNGGNKSLNPRRGGRLQLVTNFKSCCFSSSEKPSTTFQNMWMFSWSSLYSPAHRERRDKGEILYTYMYMYMYLCVRRGFIPAYVVLALRSLISIGTSAPEISTYIVHDCTCMYIPHKDSHTPYYTHHNILCTNSQQMNESGDIYCSV